MAALCRLCQRSIWPHAFVTTIAFFFHARDWHNDCFLANKTKLIPLQILLSFSIKSQSFEMAAFDKSQFFVSELVFLNCVRFERSPLWKVTVWLHFFVISPLFLTLFLPKTCRKKLEALFSIFLSCDGTVQFVGEAACCFFKWVFVHVLVVFFLKSRASVLLFCFVLLRVSEVLIWTYKLRPFT